MSSLLLEQRPLHLQCIVHFSLFFAQPHDLHSLSFDWQVHRISCTIYFGAGALFVKIGDTMPLISLNP
jgi:hypothetical protein